MLQLLSAGLGLLVASTYSSPIDIEARAATCPAGTSAFTKGYDVVFTTVKTIPGTTLNVIPDPYHNIFWRGFTVTNVVRTGGNLPGPIIQGGLAPHSKPNYAAANTITEVIGGGSAAMVAKFNDATIHNVFDLKHFYYGCTLQSVQTGLVGAPHRCNVTLVGYKGGSNGSGGTRACVQSLQFAPTAVLGQSSMISSGTISSKCEGLSYAEFVFAFAGEEPTDNLQFGIDNVAYTLRGCA